MVQVSDGEQRALRGIARVGYNLRFVLREKG